MCCKFGSGFAEAGLKESLVKGSPAILKVNPPGKKPLDIELSVRRGSGRAPRQRRKSQRRPPWKRPPHNAHLLVSEPHPPCCPLQAVVGWGQGDRRGRKDAGLPEKYGMGLACSCLHGCSLQMWLSHHWRSRVEVDYVTLRSNNAAD